MQNPEDLVGQLGEVNTQEQAAADSFIDWNRQWQFSNDVLTRRADLVPCRLLKEQIRFPS